MGSALSFAVSIIKIGLQVEKLWPFKDVEKFPVDFQRYNAKISCESFKEGLVSLIRQGKMTWFYRVLKTSVEAFGSQPK